MVSDPIGYFITQLSNAGKVKKEFVELPYSMLRHAVADKLVQVGYLASAEKHGKKVKKTLKVALVYEKDGGRSMIRGVKRISKPGRRLYAGVGNIKNVKFGKGKLILSTPKGILTGEEAKKENVGGEELFSIW